MVKMSDWSLRKKVMGGFLIVSFTAAVIGFFGWYAAAKMGAAIDRTARFTIPALENLSDMRDLALRFVQSQERVVMVYGDAEALEKEMAHIGGIQKEYKDTVVQFKSMEHAPKVMAAWGHYSKIFQDWEGANGIFFRRLQKGGEGQRVL